jgi:uncharacterized protein (TIGR00251 family)
MDYLAEQKDGSLLLTVYVQPRASRALLVGLHDGAVKLSITAPPVAGKANRAVVEYIARLFNISRTAVSIKSGHLSRTKRLTVKNISLAAAQDLLLRALPPQ